MSSPLTKMKRPWARHHRRHLIAHLARHNLSARLHRFTADASNIYNSILSLAAANSTDLIVMGGYGHSKFRKFILGGVTRGIFESLTVPALISH